jgi:hypothetical protein
MPGDCGGQCLLAPAAVRTLMTKGGYQGVDSLEFFIAIHHYRQPSIWVCGKSDVSDTASAIGQDGCPSVS